MAKSSGKSTKKSGDTKKASTEAGKKADSTKPKDSASKKTSTKKKATTKNDKAEEAKPKKATTKKDKAKEAKPKKATTKKSSNKEKEVKDKSDDKKSAPKKTKKEPALKCNFCKKTMKDKNTLKIHERNCQTKKDQETEKKLKASMLKMKDDFEDEQQSIVEKFQKREDALQNELDEMRTVLRMEMDKHRKELDMIRKVEKQIAGVAEKQSEPVHESVHEPDGQPKAIDMIPAPLPNIPKKIIEPVPIDETPHEASVPSPKEELPSEATVPEQVSDSPKSPEEHAVEKPDEPVPAISGLSKEEIEELVKSLVKESADDLPSPAGDMPDFEEFKTKIRQISGRLDSLDTKIDRFNNDMRKSFERIEKESNIKRMEKELDKVSDKIIDMMEDIGFGEDLSVTKIPPTILEIVYQATLDDIHFEIIRTKGVQDAETIARTALEEVRLKTSGSELFKFDGRKIITDNLARSISANLISAKQIQTTYDVLLDRLLETVPHHKAKNFRGMIKVKSQEFAVDRATILTKEYARLEKIIESTSQMVAAISAQSNAKDLEIQEILEDIKNNLLSEKASQEDIDNIRIKIQEQDEKDAQLDNELALLKAEIEMKEQIKVKEDTEDLAIIVPGETIDAEEIIKDKEKILESKPDISLTVLESIQNGASSKTAIVRETGLEEEDVLASITELVKDKKIIEKKIGKRIKYLTPEQELDEKLQKDKKKSKPESKKPVKEKAPAKKEAKKEEKSKAEKKKPESKKEDKPAKKEKKEELPPVDKPKEELPPVDKPKEAKPEPKKEDKPPSKAKKKDKPKEEPTKPVKEKKSAKKVELPPVDEPKAEKPAPKKPAKKDEKKETKKPVKEKTPAKEEPKKEKKPKPAKKDKKKELPPVDKPKEELPPVDKPKEEEKKPVKEKAPAKKEPAKKEKKPKKETKEPEPKKEESPDPKEPKEKHVDDDLPVITKTLKDLSDDERQVLDVLTKDGMTISGIQSKVGKSLKRFALLRALRVLIDSGYVGIITKGRMDLYQKINVTKMDKKKQNKNKQEVK